MLNIVKNFKIEGTLKDVKPYKNGLVNKTYLVTTSTKKYLLQRINKYVFKNPRIVMDNIVNVTKKLKSLNKRTLNIIMTIDDDELYFDPLSNEYFRMYDFLDNLETIELTFQDTLFFEVGKVIGDFQVSFTSFNPSLLKETIPNFHNTPYRLRHLEEVIDGKEKNEQRYEKCQSICSYLLKNKERICLIQHALDIGKIPLRITHNDTKLNNVMFEKLTHKGSCLIDLDTVMPGTMIFDFSDAVRTSCSTTKEDDPHIDLVDLDDQKFTYLLIGYLSKVKDIITKEELELLTEGIGTIIFECAVRFITDYLENDVYFKTDYPENNLVRAYNQCKLYNVFLKKEKKYQQIVKEVYKRLSF